MAAQEQKDWSVSPAVATTTGIVSGSNLTATYSGTRKAKSNRNLLT